MAKYALWNVRAPPTSLNLTNYGLISGLQCCG